MAKIPDVPCSIARSLGVLGERWTFLILRDAFEGVARFADFRESLGVASDVLSTRLGTLVEYGVLEKTEYQEPGDRRRSAYELTDAGRELFVVLAGLREWGDRHLPAADGPSVLCQRKHSGDAVRVGFVDARGREVAPQDVTMTPTDGYPKERLALVSRHRADAR
jgi:DNA-binding HxlR family transcriptional regulator